MFVFKILARIEIVLLFLDYYQFFVLQSSGNFISSGHLAGELFDLLNSLDRIKISITFFLDFFLLSVQVQKGNFITFSMD